MLTLAQALASGLEKSRGRMCPQHLRNQEKATQVVADYFKTFKPDLQHWQSVTIDDIRDYVAHLESRSLTPNTIRAYTNPLRLAHRATRTSLAVDYLKLRDIIPIRKPLAKRFLSMDQIRLALRLADPGKHRAGWFCLSMGAMAGLRLTEAMQICSETYDAARGVIVIDKAKNSDSERILPLTKTAIAVVEKHLTTPNYSSRHRAGEPYKSVSSVSHQCRRILNEAADYTGDESFKMVSPAEAGRKTFMNLCEELDLDNKYVRAYCGHAAERWDTMSRHYLGLKARHDDMPHVQDKAIRKLREHVIDPLSQFF